MAMRISSWTTVSAGEGDQVEFMAPHPGSYIRDTLLPRLKVSEAELADFIEMPVWQLTPMLEGHEPVSVEMAEALGSAFENGSEFWMELQRNYDDWRIARLLDDQQAMLKKYAVSAA